MTLNEIVYQENENSVWKKGIQLADFDGTDSNSDDHPKVTYKNYYLKGNALIPLGNKDISRYQLL